MESFKYRLPSPHSPEDTWEVLRSPIWNPLDRRIYPFTSLSYIYLDPKDNLLREGSRLIARPLKELPSYTPSSLKDTLPGHTTAKVEVLSDGKRVDVFRSDQIIQGKMERRVEAGDNNTSMLVAEGEIAIEGLDKFWPSFILGDLDKTAAYYFGRKANENILELTPQILDAAQPSYRKEKHTIIAHNRTADEMPIFGQF